MIVHYDPARLEFEDLSSGSHWPGGQFDFTKNPITGQIRIAAAAEAGSKASAF